MVERYRTEGAPLIPGAVETVRRIAAVVPVAVASSGHPSVIAAALDALGIGRLFSAVVSSDEVAVGKPAPDVYRLAASRLGVAPAACLVVEDSLNGVLAGRAAGMTVVLVPNAAIPPAPGAREAASVVLATISEVDLAAIARLPGGRSRERKAGLIDRPMDDPQEPLAVGLPRPSPGSDRAASVADRIASFRGAVRYGIAMGVSWLARPGAVPGPRRAARSVSRPARSCSASTIRAGSTRSSSWRPCRGGRGSTSSGRKEEDMSTGERNRLMIWTGTAIPFRPEKDDLIERHPAGRGDPRRPDRRGDRGRGPDPRRGA